MPAQDALQSFLRETGEAFEPLASIRSAEAAQGFFQKLGYDLSAGAAGPMTALGGPIGALVAAVQNLATADGEAGVAAAIANVLARVGQVAEAVGNLPAQLAAAGPGLDLSDLPRRVTDHVLLDFLERKNGGTHGLFHLLGLFEKEDAPAAGQPARRVNWEKFGLVFSDFRRLFNETYGWEGPDFQYEKLLRRLENLTRGMHLPGGIYPQGGATRTALGNARTDFLEMRMPIFQAGLTPETYGQFGLAFSPIEAGGKAAGLALLPFLMGRARFDFNVCDRGQLLFEGDAELTGVGLGVRPPFQIQPIFNPTAEWRVAIGIRERPERSEELILIGSRGGTRLSMQNLGVKWFGEQRGGRADFGFEGEIEKIRLVIASGEGDGFLQDAFAGLRVQAEFGFGLGATIERGFFFRGSGAFEVELGIHISLGPIEIRGLKIRLQPEEGQFRLDAGANIKLELGPFVAVIENIGLRSRLEFRQGNLGSANLEMGFKPPTGIGLSLDTSVVRGGGYLLFDDDRKEYAGALELSIKSTISVTAIGVVTTRFPDGSDGFSLLLIIGVTFQPGIALGFGFFLNGLGGMIGIHRTIDTAALRAGVKNGAIDRIMFPENVVANIQQIIADIRTIFPPKRDQFMIGFMARITWGVPTLLTVDFGLCVEFASPVRIAILGTIKLVLPTEEAAILRIQVNFLGLIDFEQGMLSFDASLYNSRILTFALEGDMALRISWGREPGFVLSVGGFHPVYKIPANLQIGQMARLSLTIFADNPLLRLSTYFAVTSNSVQFGAKLELRVEAGPFSVEGELGFDVLFQFSPFYFNAQITARLAVKAGGATIFSVSLRLSLEGPTPWIARGSASISILFFEISVDFEVRWGEERRDVLPPIAILAKVVEALSLDRNWSALLPEGRVETLTLKELKGESGAEPPLVLQPFGSLKIEQHIAPLGLEMNKFGHNRPADVRKISLSELKIEGAGRSTEAVREAFAPSNFREMSDDDKLRAADYAQEISGLRLRPADDLKTGYAIGRTVEYEMHVSDYFDERDNPQRRLFRPRFLGKKSLFDDGLFSRIAAGGAAGKSELSKELKEKSGLFSSKKVELNESPSYAVVDASTLSRTASAALFEKGTRAEASDFARKSTASGLRAVPAYLLDED